MKKIVPLGKNVLIKIAEIEKVTKGGIILPGKDENEKPQKGKVVSVGDHKEIDSKIKIGAQVIFDKYEGTEIEIDKEKFVIIKSKKILAVAE